MARRVARPAEFVGSLYVLDAHALSLLTDDDRRMLSRTKLAVQEGFRLAISVVTLVEQRRAGRAGNRMAWVRSSLKVVPVSEAVADRAADLLEATGLDKYQCVVDAIVVATAASTKGQARVASSDGSHIPMLCKAVSEQQPGSIVWTRV